MVIRRNIKGTRKRYMFQKKKKREKKEKEKEKKIRFPAPSWVKLISKLVLIIMIILEIGRPEGRLLLLLL